MAHWIYFVRPPRENFVATISEEEAGDHGRCPQRPPGPAARGGHLVLAGPTFGPGLNDGIAIIEAETEDDARAVMESDPAITSGLMTGELRPMRVSFLRGA